MNLSLLVAAQFQCQMNSRAAPRNCTLAALVILVLGDPHLLEGALRIDVHQIMT